MRCSPPLLRSDSSNGTEEGTGSDSIRPSLSIPRASQFLLSDFTVQEPNAIELIRLDIF